MSLYYIDNEIDNEGFALSDIYDALQRGVDIDAPEDAEANENVWIQTLLTKILLPA